MTDLTTLIARLEAATAPDRELDAEIMFDMFASPVGQHHADGGPVGYIRLDDQPSWNLGIHVRPASSSHDDRPSGWPTSSSGPVGRSDTEA